MDYGYGHSFSIFIHYPHLNWLGEFTGKKNGRRILPLHFLWFGWGGSGFGDIYQFVIYLRRFFFFFLFFLFNQGKMPSYSIPPTYKYKYIYFFLRGSNGFPTSTCPCPARQTDQKARVGSCRSIDHTAV